MQNAALLDKSDPSSGKEYYLPAKFHGMNPFMWKEKKKKKKSRTMKNPNKNNKDCSIKCLDP